MTRAQSTLRSANSGRRVGLGVLLLALAGVGLWRAWGRSSEAEAALPREERSFTLFLLGGSTAWGEPYNPRADLGLVVSWLLGGEIGGRPIRVVNRAGQGKASTDVLEDARALGAERFAPGTAVALLYLGNNEFLRFDTEHDLSRNERTLFDRPTLAPVARATVLETYAKNIDGIVGALQAAGVGVIASTVAVNLEDWEPNRSVLRDPDHAAEVKRLLAEGERERAAGRDEAALAAYANVLALEPELALASKLAGDCLRALGRFAEARAHYQDAVDHDGNPYRESTEQTRLLRDVCERRGVPVVDAAALLEAASADGSIGFELMWDNCHPTLEGYARIAEGFATVLVEHYGARRAREALDLAALERDLGFDDAFRSGVLASRGQYCYVSSSLTFDPAPRLARARLYLEQARALTPDDADLACSLAILAALEDDVEGSLAEWRRAFGLDPNVARQRARLLQVQAVMARRGIERLPALLRAER